MSDPIVNSDKPVWCWNCPEPARFRDRDGTPFCSNTCAIDYMNWLLQPAKRRRV